MDIKERNFFEKNFGKKVCTEKLNVESVGNSIPFDIYDGYAVCENYKGHRYDMEYPQLCAVKDSDELSDAVIEYVGNISDKEEISVIHILMAFNTLNKDGVEIKPKN